MNPTVIVGVVSAVIIGCLSFGLYLVSERLLTKTELVGDLKGQVSAKQAIIDMKNQDADLSGKLAAIQTAVDRTLTSVGQIGRETIINVPLQNAACNSEPVLAVTSDIVQRTRDAYRAGSASTGRGSASIVRVPSR